MKYLQTKSEKFEDLVQQIRGFKINLEESAETSWERFSSLRKTLEKEKLDENFNTFLMTLFLTECVKSNTIQKSEE